MRINFTMEYLDQNKEIMSAVVHVENNEQEYDPLKLQRLTQHYAELVDAQGKLWVVSFGNNEWHEQTAESFNREDVPPATISSDKIDFQNKEEAFIHLKTLAFKKEIEKSISIAHEYNMDAQVYNEVLDLLDRADKESDSVRRKQLLIVAYKMFEQKS